MKLFEYIQILSTLVWLVVPFVRIRSKHFYFFLFLGVSDLIAGILWFGFNVSSQTFWIPFFYLIVFSISKDYFIKNIKNILLGFIIILILNFYSTTYIQYIFVLLANIIILTIFARYLYWEFIQNDKISLFYMIMTFYGLFSLSKSILLVSNIKLGMNAYFVGTILQIVIGLYLIFVRRDVKISLKL